MATRDYPSFADLTRARKRYRVLEPRNVFYGIADDLVSEGIRSSSTDLVKKGLAVLLFTWNRRYYRGKDRRFDRNHIEQIGSVLRKHLDAIRTYRRIRISRNRGLDREKIESIFEAFENVVGSTGSAKALHLLAPGFFPMWDRRIAKGYGMSLGKVGTNAGRYFRFMQATREQVRRLGRRRQVPPDVLKRLDEYNYCKYTKREDLS